MIIFLIICWSLLGILSMVISLRISKGNYLDAPLTEKILILPMVIVLGPVALLIALTSKI